MSPDKIAAKIAADNAKLPQSEIKSIKARYCREDTTLGLYIHIPFCAHRCPYCDFAIHIGARPEFVDAYVQALNADLTATLQQHREEQASEAVDTIFFGGGTPTALAAEQLTLLLDTVRANVALASQAEISIEANPDLLAPDELVRLRAAGFNRLSFGAQSLDDAELKRIGRTHKASAVAAAVDAGRRAGFDNISLDLIYALPGQSRADWQRSLRGAVALQVEHVSCYALTIESGTPFARLAQQGQLQLCADEGQAQMMQDAAQILGEAGILRYEVSNYACAGRECRHNLNYWRGGNYLAAGCGAHGHRDGRRWWNQRSAPIYVKLMSASGSARVGEELLTPVQRLTEAVMLGLRLREGFCIPDVSRRVGLDVAGQLAGPLVRLTQSGLVRRRGDVVMLAPDAVAVTDAVASRLLGP